MMNMKLTLILAALFFASQTTAHAAAAKAEIKGTAIQPEINGTATFTQQEDGKMKVNIQAEGVPPGPHAIHIHENGSCENNAEAAGSHWNPEGKPHGNVVENGFDEAHPGDFGNIEINENGFGTKEFTVEKLSIGGEQYNILDHAIVLHAQEDTFEQPTGEAGERIACGIIKQA